MEMKANTSGPSFGYHRIQFTDSTQLTAAQVSQLAVIKTTNDDDILKGSNSCNDIINGGAGKDKLYGMGGNDTLGGGTGNDYLEGGRGGDTYIWDKGWGTISSITVFYLMVGRVIMLISETIP